MKAQDLKNSILQLAMEGKLVPQDSNDEPASVLLDKIKAEKEQLIKEKKIKRNNKESTIFRKNNHFYEKIGKNGEEVCIDDEIPFEIPDSWEWVRFGSLINFSIGKTPQRKNHDFWQNGKIPWVSIKDMVNGEIIFSTKEKINQFALKKSFNNNIVSKDTLLMSFKLTVGKVSILGMDSVHNEAIISIKTFADSDYKLRNYLFYLLPLISQFGDTKSAIKGKTLNSKSLNKLLIPLPPLEEQKRIVKKIKNLIPFINKYSELKEELDGLNKEFPEIIKRLILQEAIQGKLVEQNPDDEPASILLKRISKEKEQLIKDKKIKRNKKESFIYKENNHFYEKIGENGETICIDEELPFEIPNNWCWCRLGNIVYNFGQKKPDKTFSYIDVGSIDNKNLRLNNKENIINKNKAPSRARKMVKKGAVIYSTVRPYLLNMCIIDKEFSHEPIASTAFAILNPFNGLLNKYLFYYLQSATFINYVNSQMSGVAYPAINDKNLYNSLIALPPINEQKRIIKQIDLLLNKLKN